MKAIETAYAGCRFRSRLEARWAVFLDTLGIEWRYEPEGFVLNQDRPYLPDFYLPASDTWVEVKPSPEHIDWLELVAMDGGSMIPGMSNSIDTNRGLAILYDIPDPRLGEKTIPVLQHYKGQWWSQGCWSITGINRIGRTIPFEYEQPPPTYRIPATRPLVLKGYAAARSARFEFSERESW